MTSQLNCAAEKGHLGVSALLMQRGANTRAMDSYLRTPIMNACAKQHLLCVQALLPHADLAHLNKYGCSLLHIAASKGGPAVLGVILPRYVEAGLVDCVSASALACSQTNLHHAQGCAPSVLG